MLAVHKSSLAVSETCLNAEGGVDNDIMVPSDDAALAVAGPSCELDSDRGSLLVLEVDITRPPPGASPG